MGFHIDSEESAAHANRLKRVTYISLHQDLSTYLAFPSLLVKVTA